MITQGSESTIVAVSGEASVQVFPVTKIAKENIIDTNGAGDMTAGGFVGAQVLGLTLAQSVEVGHRLGAMCIKEIGPQLSYPVQDVLAGL